ncbi:8-oxo-dGTP diphosphatase MutT [Echinimonas agarilytica]|uniref:8-oxo-dGTP diphosphatase n=1 Tax=Echinimonas agarilytica TaxID=1215918 RepID=A0AA42B6K7_9GAMM|nr:8-oxo-dGTP diphosphatase MutT [Echinimonas agarilytica]MCM2678789.1 8-oxo-dGTP diphosphatase MutT [Echinimonas agarilytica]
MKVVHVAVGVIERDRNIFITRRASHQHQGGKWEFPGGKCEGAETVLQALSRELHEEIGIECHSFQPLVVIQHDYGDKQVKLDTHWVRDFAGEPTGLEGQEGRWVAVEELSSYEFPEANEEILKRVVSDLSSL